MGKGKRNKAKATRALLEFEEVISLPKTVMMSLIENICSYYCKYSELGKEEKCNNCPLNEIGQL